MVVVVVGGIATAGAAFAQPEWSKGPWAPLVPEAVELMQPDFGSADDVATEVAQAEASSSKKRAWPSWRAVEIVDPWSDEADASPGVTTVASQPGQPDVAKQAPSVAPAEAPGSWARVLRDPAPRFSRVSTEPASTTSHWARPMTDIVNPWGPRKSSWVPRSEVIVDPWSDT